MKSILDLDPSTVLDYTTQVEVDKSSYPESKRQTLDAILRGKPTKSYVATSLSTYTVDFTDTPNVTVEISLDITLNLSGIKEGEAVYLMVEKNLSNTIAFSGARLKGVGGHMGQTNVQFRIEKMFGVTYVTQMSTLIGASVPIGSLTCANGVVNSVTRFKFTIEGNVCYFSAELVVTVNVTGSSITIGFPVQNFTKVNTTEPVAGTMRRTEAEYFDANSALGTQTLQYFNNTTAGDTYELSAAGSFLIK